MMGQRERLDWCVREIERLKVVSTEKTDSQLDDDASNECFDGLEEPEQMVESAKVAK